ncbi:MAG: septum formation initiator family protein [Fusobacterium gastrosuis]|uniref:FtsB family cell division protein n=1 Tax=Fusobacterium TaxID=848 RepID=UPI0025B9EFE0|nr:septum formation initiator family protein [Fusobacterium sp.]MCI7223910.1 septum formation initiator family protein [Fusobacterium sp.]MDD7410503.1 septum formation initiator family protein [Fusobacteriaceae bacterium]MDY4011572.1 septum formation initiator family protein [Fusobacterium gastrosuis]MDY5712836.1 septum formation initiator family protein [Fusobacterium gastrosuis]
MDKKILISLGIISLFSLNVVPQIKNNISKKENLEAEIENTTKKIALLDEQIVKYDNFIKKLETDFEQEKIARNKLKMIKENEVIYKLVIKDKEDK